MTDAAVALVAGAGGTIGAEIAASLAESGHPVGLTDVDAASLERLGTIGQSHRVVGDATRPECVDHIVGEVEASLGPVGVLVNALGTYGPRSPFSRTDPDDWWRVLEVNVRGPALLVRRIVAGMLERGRGHIVNVGSRAATWDDPGGSSVAYSVSKAALRRFTQALAAELDGTGVIVVEVSPGFVRSAMTADRPGIEDLPDDAFVPPSLVASRVAALVSGRYDALHGRFVHVDDDLDRLLAGAAGVRAAKAMALEPLREPGR